MTWVRPLLRQLGVAHGKVLLMIQDGQPTRVREFVRSLLAVEPGLYVCTEIDELLAAPPEATIIFNVRGEFAGWLNVNRPVFARNRWRVVLWAPPGESERLMSMAPDFMDWISHVTICPPGPSNFALANLRAFSSEIGVTWVGEGLDETLRAWRPNGEVRTLSMLRTYAGIMQVLKRHPNVAFVVRDVNSAAQATRLRWALAEAQHVGLVIVTESRHNVPGFRTVESQPLTWPAATDRLRTAAAPHPALLASLLDLEPTAIERACRHAADVGWSAVLLTLQGDADPGATFGNTASTIYDRPVREFHDSIVYALSLGDTAQDLWTAFCADQVERTEDIAVSWASRPPAPVVLPRQFLPWVPGELVVEASLRTPGIATSEARVVAACWASALKHPDVAETWCDDLVVLDHAAQARAEAGAAFVLALLAHAMPGLAHVVASQFSRRLVPDRVALDIAKELLAIDPQRALDWLEGTRAGLSNNPCGEEIVLRAWARGANSSLTEAFPPGEAVEVLLHKFGTRQIRDLMSQRFGATGFTPALVPARRLVSEVIEWLRMHDRLLELPEAVARASPELRSESRALAGRLGASSFS